ncbi:MAG: hypothetical protein LUE93_16940 [Bacteroides sp.]|nr:hypothetical protein [Bacteroides sp.]
MAGVSRIRETKNWLRTATCRMTEDLDFETTTFETEILPGTMVCAELESREYDSYKQLSLLWVEAIKDGEKREVILPNISRFIFRELEKTIRRMNREEYREKAVKYRVSTTYSDY